MLFACASYLHRLDAQVHAFSSASEPNAKPEGQTDASSKFYGSQVSHLERLYLAASPSTWQPTCLLDDGYGVSDYRSDARVHQ